MKNIIAIFSCLIILTSISVDANPDNENKHDKHEQHEQHDKHSKHKKRTGSVTQLSPKIRDLLQQEMRSIQLAISNIIPAIISGENKTVAKIAGNIEQSYILKQKLTKQQKHELHKKLSRSFLKMDQDFHYYAGMLQHVALENKPELINFYFSKLVESCAGCHSQHATHRFPQFLQLKKSQQHDH